jgi:hypothetical protein
VSSSGSESHTSPGLLEDPPPLPLDVDTFRAALGGAPKWTDEDLQGVLDVAFGHIVPTLKAQYQPDPDTGEYPPWPADLVDGVLLAGMLTLRNRESPAGANTDTGYGAAGFGVPNPTVPPIAWDPRIRHRLGRFVDPGVWVG